MGEGSQVPVPVDRTALVLSAPAHYGEKHMSDELELETDDQIEQDPVCGAAVSLDEAAAHSLAFEYEGRDYLFCSAACRARFEHEPRRYASAGRSAP